MKMQQSERDTEHLPQTSLNNTAVHSWLLGLSAFYLLTFGQFWQFSFQTPAALMENAQAFLILKPWKFLNYSQNEQSKCVLHVLFFFF